MTDRSKRIPWIDVLRGIAIILMIPANLSPIWTQPHALWFRVLASYAASTFVMLSAGMVMLNSDRHSFIYFMQRGLLVIGFGVFMDICVWHYFPFVTCDVLYLIGLAIPIIYLLRYVNAPKLMVIIFVIFISTPILQNLFGYHSALSEITWHNRHWPGTLRILQTWLIDGWFPVFPWLGISLFGAVFFQTVLSNKEFLITKEMTFFAVLFLLIGFFILFAPTQTWHNMANHGIMADREGYSEIFYPPTLGYSITTMGMIILFAKLAQFILKIGMDKTFSLFGRYSLLVYILHQVILVYVILPILKISNLETISGTLFAATVILTILACYSICLLTERLKRVYSPSLLIFQMLIGK